MACLLARAMVLGIVLASGQVARVERTGPPLILAHDMPWFSAPPVARGWGWHWTMNAFDPARTDRERPSIASHYRPLIGPYDSTDPAVIEYHLLLMKLAGFDGLIVDWYGTSDHADYPELHRATAALFPIATLIGLKVAICYEDQTVTRLVEAGRISPGDRVRHAAGELEWLRKDWFARPAYLKLQGRPVLLSFGITGLSDEEWQQVLAPLGDRVVYLSEHRRRPGAAGGFDWPVPGEGIAAVERFERASRDWPVRMPAAFPRFHDMYREAGVGPSYGRIADDDGRTLATTLERALRGGAPLVQVVTWNDWGEGTQVEPSAEFGYRDLEVVQRLRRAHVDPAFAPGPDDLRLVHRLYQLRRRGGGNAAAAQAMDEIARRLASGHCEEARRLLADVERLPR